MRRIAIAVALAAAGCATSRGFDRGRIATELRPDLPPLVTEEEIARVLALRPQITPPFRLAVWFKPGVRPTPFGPVRWSWTPEDREAVLAMSDTLRREGITSQVVAITDETITGTDLRAIRLAAARHGSDAVLVVSGAAEVDRYNNASAALYVTLVGYWIVPGTKADALFLASGTLWDVRNEYLYLSAQAEATEARVGPGGWLEDAHVIAAAKKKALPALREELLKRMRSLAPATGTAAPGGAPAAPAR